MLCQMTNLETFQNYSLTSLTVNIPPILVVPCPRNFILNIFLRTYLCPKTTIIFSTLGQYVISVSDSSMVSYTQTDWAGSFWYLLPRRCVSVQFMLLVFFVVVGSPSVAWFLSTVCIQKIFRTCVHNFRMFGKPITACIHKQSMDGEDDIYQNLDI